MQFKDVIDSIKKYAFVSSPYPVILSLEIHCGIEQQDVMADMFREVFGDLLLTEPLALDESALPSPELLIHKILIKVPLNRSFYNYLV